MQGFDKASAQILADIGGQFQASFKSGGMDLEHPLISG
jgi:hypothetical protein